MRNMQTVHGRAHRLHQSWSGVRPARFGLPEVAAAATLGDVMVRTGGPTVESERARQQPGNALVTAAPVAVPFVTLWSGERDGAMPVVWRRGRGIGYADERSYDRDDKGVLWSRVASQPGRGKPLLGKVHSLRQRVAMAQLRCQVCGGPADRAAAGLLWLIDARPGELLPGEEETAHPPVCRPCATWSVRACPHLRPAFTAVRVRAFEPAGVNGVIYGRTPSGPKEVDAAPVAFGSLLMPYVRAHQLLMRLIDFHSVDLADPYA